ncbi:MAG: SOS response-associated peptidase family protein [Comamonas sp.]
MCNRYEAPTATQITRQWRLESLSDAVWPTVIHPRTRAPFLRGNQQGLALVVGRWGLIPPFAKSPAIKYSTNNARSEELAAKPTYRDAWMKGQRCIIPAASFDEPCWESGRNQWWRFERADGMPWGLAGLWNAWTDRSTGEIHESYTMLTINADSHPLMRRMHKSDPALPPDAQDKRSVIVVEQAEVDWWLWGSMQEALALLKLSPTEIFKAGPAAMDLQQALLL